jgi:hypothetical protein
MRPEFAPTPIRDTQVVATTTIEGIHQDATTIPPTNTVFEINGYGFNTAPTINLPHVKRVQPPISELKRQALINAEDGQLNASADMFGESAHELINPPLPETNTTSYGINIPTPEKLSEGRHLGEQHLTTQQIQAIAETDKRLKQVRAMFEEISS